MPCLVYLKNDLLCLLSRDPAMGVWENFIITQLSTIVMAARALILFLGTAAFLLWQGIDGAVDFVNAEARLYTNLTRKYNKNIRPVHNASRPININLGVALIQLLNFDETQQVIHTLVWLRKQWKDVALTWNPNDFEGIDHIRLPNDVIWKPDIVLYNSMSDKWEYPGHPKAVVSFDGNVLFIPPMHLHSTCSVDLTKFPFDEQICNLKFGSWTFDGFQVDISFYSGLKAIDTTDFIVNNEWMIAETTGVRNVKYYPCCEEPYPDLTFTIKMKRRMGQYAHTLLAPSVVLALLIPVVFLLPTGSSEKTYLGVGVLLGLALMALFLDRAVPKGSPWVPVIVIYNLVSVVLTAVCLLMAAVVNMTWTKSGDVPAVLKFVFLNVLGRVLCVPEEPYVRVLDDENPGSDVKSPSRVGSGWRRLSRVVDRLCLIIFFLVSVIMTIAMMA